MGDAADILGVVAQPPARSSGDALSLLAGPAAHKTSVRTVRTDKTKKPKGMSRELFNLMGKDGIAPAIQTNAPVKNTGFKNKRKSSTQGKWVWTEYQSSARGDSQPFSHWVKADLQAFDYVYAKFNTKLDPVTYSNEEYESLLKDAFWTRSETDQLMYICHEFNLRWPVIADRFESTTHRSTEDLMARYYFVTTKLKTQRNEKKSGNFSNQVIPSASFDVEFERARRKQQDKLFQMSAEDQAEEMALREELKNLDASIKKIKKTMKSVPPPAPTATNTNSKASTAAASSSKKKTQKDQVTSAPLVASTAASIAAASVGGSVAAGVLLKAIPPIIMYGGIMTPAPNQPCLQSARLAFTNETPDFSKKVVTGFEGTSGLDLSEPFIVKLKHFSQEIGMPDKLLPTRAICDLNDQIRKNMAILLSLKGKITKNEDTLTALREQNPDINAAAYGTYFGGHATASGPECRLSVPDSTFLLKESDSAGQSSAIMKPYVPGAPLALVPPLPAPVEKGNNGDKDKGGSSTSGSKTSKASGATTTDSTGKTTKKPSKSKRKASDISKDTSPNASSSMKPPLPTAEQKSKSKSAAPSKPVVKKINPVLAKAATIPIPPLNNTPQSIAIAAAANAVKAKLAAEQKAASEGTSMSNSQQSTIGEKAHLGTASLDISAAVKAVTSSSTSSIPGGHTVNSQNTVSQSLSTPSNVPGSLSTIATSSASTVSSSVPSSPRPSSVTLPGASKSVTVAQPQSSISAPSNSKVATSGASEIDISKKREVGDNSDESNEPSLKRPKAS